MTFFWVINVTNRTVIYIDIISYVGYNFIIVEHGGRHMQKSAGKCLVTVFITMLMVMAVTQPIVSLVGSDGSSNQVLDGFQPDDSPTQTNNPDGGINDSNGEGILDLGSSSSTRQKSGKLVKVVIATSNIGSLATFLED